MEQVKCKTMEEFDDLEDALADEEEERKLVKLTFLKLFQTPHNSFN